MIIIVIAFLSRQRVTQTELSLKQFDEEGVKLKKPETITKKHSCSFKERILEVRFNLMSLKSA